MGAQEGGTISKQPERVRMNNSGMVLADRAEAPERGRKRAECRQRQQISGMVDSRGGGGRRTAAVGSIMYSPIDEEGPGSSTGFAERPKTSGKRCRQQEKKKLNRSDKNQARRANRPTKQKRQARFALRVDAECPRIARQPPSKFFEFVEARELRWVPKPSYSGAFPPQAANMTSKKLGWLGLRGEVVFFEGELNSPGNEIDTRHTGRSGKRARTTAHGRRTMRRAPRCNTAHVATAPRFTYRGHDTLGPGTTPRT
ncbi:hypothetical protein B0H11DRAFT_1926865 [Mycena galericulata]|nr:hypothetical protein B0H11DRAFT_1926865 [Mycena galericulata]